MASNEGGVTKRGVWGERDIGSTDRARAAAVRRKGGMSDDDDGGDAGRMMC